MATVTAKKTAKRNRALGAYVQSEGKCYYCSLPLEYDRRGEQWNIDHIIPRAAGGTNAPENLVATCIPCNTLKGHLSVQEFKQKVQGMCEHYQEFIERYAQFAK